MARNERNMFLYSLHTACGSYNGKRRRGFSSRPLSKTPESSLSTYNQTERAKSIRFGPYFWAAPYL